MDAQMQPVAAAQKPAATAAPAVVRIATAADEPEIIRLLHLMHAEGGMLPLDEGCAREIFARAFNREGGIIGVIGEPDSIQAMIYLLITRFWYTRDNHLEELFNYVRPDSRKTDHAKTLISYARKCSDQIGIPLVIGVLANRAMEAKVRLYRQMLGFPSGAFFVHGAKWENASPTNEDFWRAPFPENSRKARRLARRFGNRDTPS